MNHSSRPARETRDVPITLVGLLRERTEQSAERLAYRFIKDLDTDTISITYAELDRRARAIGAWLQASGAVGERALLLYPPGLDYIASFFGCLYAGVTAVPAYPPRLNRPVPRIQSIVADSQAAFALTTSAILTNIEQRFEHTRDLQALHWFDTEQVPQGLESEWREPVISPETLAFLQYTSGSTSKPKGVMLTHGNLMHNLKAIQAGFRINSDDSGAFWLPSYHDMGLIGGILEPMYICCPSTLMSPVSFLQRPIRWLEIISRFQATVTGAPNFAFDLCAEKVTTEQLATLDLSCLKLAFCGAEPIRPETLDRFARTFEACGLRREAFYPCFGLAEGTLLVSGGDGPSAPRSVSFDRKALERDLVVAASPEQDGAQSMVSCGRSIIDQEIVIVDPATMQRVEPGRVGEIWISGPSVARGYWGLPEETRQTFHAHPGDGGNGPFLRTGDLGFQHEGELFVTGRLKDLIIIHGSNHYPQDIELTVETCHPVLQPGAGAAFSVSEDGQERLVIVHEVTRQNRHPNINEAASAIRKAVAEAHDLQIFAVVLVKPLSILKTSSGKIQRQACKAAFIENTLDVIAEWRAKTPSTPHEADQRSAQVHTPVKETPDESHRKSVEAIKDWLVTRIAALQGLDAAEIDPRQPFTYYGLGSVQAVGLAGELETFLNRRLAPTLAWDYPTIESLANHLAADSQQSKTGVSPSVSVQPPRPMNEPIAIIGLSCRFPGASNPQAFWELLRNGVDTISEVPSDRWNMDSFYSPDAGAPGKITSRWGGFIEGADLFDPQFFGISPREASRMDPQQRILLEVVWEALENAFVPPHSIAGSRTGVFIGISSYDYSQLQFGDPEAIDAYAGTGNAHSIAANRLSYLFDLRGPSMAIDTACSSSLVAAHLACQSLRSGESDLAIVGGVNLILTPELTITFSQARMLSPDGRCKTFDAKADGYVRGEGCGVVILKRVSDALRAGDNILALIRGSAVNQDGRSNGLTAPNGLAQQAVIRDALANAQVSPDQVSYVEAHGTGTPLGDPIEMSSLRAVLDGERLGDKLLVGSVKTNIGHLEAAAGIAGLIKTVLALQYEAIPPHLHLKEINPYLSLEDSRLEIGTYLRPWKRRERPRIAGVSSFGFGGTNAHMVISEAPPIPNVPADKDQFERPRHLLTLSAKTRSALQELVRSKSLDLESGQASLADVAYTANTRRSHFEHRLAIQAGSHAELKSALEAFISSSVSPNISIGHAQPGARPKIAFLFTGQGAQYAGMGCQLYETQPVFREALDKCAKILNSLLQRPLLEVIFQDETLLHQTTYTQPALFALEYSLAQMWRSWGLEPHAVMGHSVGEYAAACLAGVFSLEEGLRLITERARLMGALPQNGSMAAVFSDGSRVAETLRPYQDSVSIAATNGPANTVISGENGAVQAVLTHLAKLGIASRPLAVSHAFHSPLMDSILDDFERAASQIQFNIPRLSLVSNLTGAVLAPDQFPDTEYWKRHIREEVKFSAGMQSLSTLDIDVFLEIGPGPVLIGMGRQCLPESRAAWLPSLRQGQDDWQTALASLGSLYVLGADLDWSGFDSGYARRKVSLPNYPFERQRYWVESTKQQTSLRIDKAPIPVSSSTPRSNGKVHPQGETPQSRVSLLHREVNDLDHVSLLAASEAERQKVLEDFLQRQVARVLGMDSTQLSIHQPLDTLGLDSLMAMELKNALESKLGLKLSVASFLQGPTIAGLASEAVQALGSPDSANELRLVISRQPSPESPLSYGQQALWFLHQLLPEDVSFNVAGAVRILGELDVHALERAFEQTIARHESLRSTFHVVEGEPVQRVHPFVGTAFQFEDASAWNEPELRARLVDEAHRPFDLENGPVLRALLFSRNRGSEHILLLSMDHIVTDFWSMTVLARDLLALYQANRSGKVLELSVIPAHYSDYVRWQRDMLARPQGEKLWEYWRHRLGDKLPLLDLPTDRPRPPLQTYRGDSANLLMEGDLYERIKAIAQERGATPFMALLAAFQVLLHRYSGQDEFLVGSVTAGRGHTELANMVGYFINPVALHADLSGTPSFDEILKRVRQTVLDAFEHQDYPPALLAKRLGLQRDPSRPPLFETMFIFQKAHAAEVQALSPFALGMSGARMNVDGLTLESIAIGGEPAQFDLTMMMAETGNGLAAALQYNADLFDAQTIERMLAHFHSLLKGIVADPLQPVSSYSLLGESERQRLLVEWNDTLDNSPRHLCVHELVEEQARKTPKAVAVQFNEESLTYFELEQRASQLADMLRSQGVKPGTLVGLFLNRSIEMLIGLLGVLKAGGAYLPLDPSFPSERIAFMLADSGASLILTQEDIHSKLPGHNAVVICFEDLQQHEIHGPSSGTGQQVMPDDLAYVIYTSGSTGKPKGVQIHHEAVVNFLCSMREHLKINSEDGLLAVTTLSFDIAVLELILPLIVGARAVIAPADVAADGALLAKALVESNATMMQATPASWRSLLETGWQGKNDLTILCGGEAMTSDLAERLLKRGAELWNLYGPTETTIWSTIHKVAAPVDSRTTIPIGRPIANTQTYILDSNLQPVPVGVTGDLYIGGDGVSRGYLNRPELTEEKFIPNPFTAHSRIYKTGDLARYLPHGNIEFLGRSDQQVKVRGFRIETGEVEVALAQHPAVEKAVVTARWERSSDASLVAYVVPDQGQDEADPGQLRDFLRQKLPEYMVPSIFVTLESLPLTPNGKVDRKALPAPSQARPELRAAYVAPRTPLEGELAEACAQVLGLESGERVGVHDNFFDLGGHSLLGTRLVFMLREKYGLEPAALPLRTLFEQPTVANLAKTIELALSGERIQAAARGVIRMNQLSLEQLRAEAKLDPSIRAGDLVYEPVETPARVLLTGATGFLGAFLLRDLMKMTATQVYCLVRADNAEGAMRKLKRNLESYSLWEEAFETRIEPVLGHLDHPQLGLSDADFNRLADEIETIYHNGAMVNFVYPYHAHKPSNVFGTQEVLRLACRKRLKPVHFISTLSILHSGDHDDGRVFREDDDLVTAPFGGYAQSKWVAERLLAQAGSRGIPFAIYRPGLITGDSLSGACNKSDMLSNLTRVCLLLGTAPDLDVMIDIVPVDFVSASVVHLSKDPKNLGKVYHLDNPQQIHLSQLVDWLGEQGFQARKVPFDSWRAELFKQVAHMPADGWEPYLPLIEEVEEKQIFMPKFDLSNTLEGLKGSGIDCPPVDLDLLATYIEYFTRQGFLPRPERKPA